MPHTGHMDEIYCEDCGARFRNDCTCPSDDYIEYYIEYPDPETSEHWRGMDGHLYYGDPKRASSAMHDEYCGCPGSVNFDPDSWY